jgi:septal ring factor EnvC (AmiA/AmiB activator)
MAYPVSGLLLLPYGGGLDPVTHRQVRLDGILLGAPAGSPVRSPCDAQVKAVRSGPPVGQEVVLQPLGRPQVQVHLVGVAGVKVRVGQRVRKGQTLGQVPAVGPRLVPHLFLEVTVHGVAVDPLSPLFLGPPA